MFERYTENPNINNSVRTVLYAIDEGCKWLKSLFAPKLFANFYFVKGNDSVDDGVLHDAKKAEDIKSTSASLEFQEEEITKIAKPTFKRQDAIQEEESDSGLSDDEMNEAWDNEGMFEGDNDYKEVVDPYYAALKSGINPLAEMIGHHHTSSCVSGGCEHKSVHELVGHHSNLIEAAGQ